MAELLKLYREDTSILARPSVLSVWGIANAQLLLYSSKYLFQDVFLEALDPIKILQSLSARAEREPRPRQSFAPARIVKLTSAALGNADSSGRR